MRKEDRQKISWYARLSRYRSTWRKFVRAMACIVAFCTTYALILPAITAERDYQCGVEEHIHEELCYTQQSVMTLACTQNADDVVIHSHEGICYDGQGVLVCSLPERIVHTHGESCMARSEVPSCEYVHIHSEACTGQQKTLICTLEESEGHTHGDGCGEMQQVLICTDADPAHVHAEACYMLELVPCAIAVTPGHTHAEECWQTQELVCELTVNDGHIHEDACYPTQQVCQLEELSLHVHEENCYGADGALTCTEQVVTAHQHSEGCLQATEQVQSVLTCGKEVHSHEESCYAAEEPSATVYLCGQSVHTHEAACYGADTLLICTETVHRHEAACLVAELDLTADVETAQQWEAAFAELTLTGDWAQDVLAIAETQLGYRESAKNVILEGEVLKGYTRYGAKYGRPYDNWSAMFVSFCLEYAEVKDFPVNTDSAAWAAALSEQQLLIPAGEFLPQAGDLIFLDTDGNGAADHMAIAAEQTGENGQWKFIAGDGKNGCVEYETYALTSEQILGGCALPENPAAPDSQAAAVTAMIHGLPTAEAARESLLRLNNSMDQEAFDAYLNELKTRVAAAREAYTALDDTRKALVENLSRLEALETVCAEAVWKTLTVLTEDGALVTELNAVQPENALVENQQTAHIGFHAELKSYSDAAYGDARVKLEIVLPLAEEQAVFDMEAMPWLEDGAVTLESRTLGETETQCQVLTGYRHLKAADVESSVVPGSFTEYAAVKVLDMEHNDRISLLISAAMEHNTWEGTCEAHQTEEKLTITSAAFLVSAPASAEEQQAEYEALLQEYEDLLTQELSEEELAAAAKALLNKVMEAEHKGRLSEEAVADLELKLAALLYGDLNSLAEPAIGENWKVLRDSGWFEEYSNAVAVNPQSSTFTVTQNAISAPAVAALDEPSDVQVRREGGEESSSEGAVYVSKTIDGTDVENVFDITLEIVTQDVVTEVYKEPDMEVVIVLDISNTMNTNFGGVTRYAAAMTAAENFLRQFAANNMGASNVGFVAFNTDAHEIFPMSPCSTDAQVNTLINTMRTKTGNIINNYTADDIKRFTNIEAGLKRAYDLLGTTDNEHQYIVFLSDGFPTTYIQSGYTGYNTYDPNGTVFYDSVGLGIRRPCAYGTSYSNEAAIRARRMAENLKNAGATIFSIGVDVGTQTIAGYERNDTRAFSVIDRRNTNYEIGAADDKAAFTNWLTNSIGSGNGYYYESTNATGLNNAFNSIFARIKELNAASSHLDWVASDPMPDMGVHEMEAMEFIGFYNRDGVLVDGDLVGESKDGWQYENTASFDIATQTIHWDLKNSGYISTAMGNTTNYECTLTYRVRLKNENENFEEYLAYDTNDVTTLTYRIIDQTGDRVTVSEQRTVSFPIPAVEGYLENLEFTKVNSIQEPLAGATFTLSHDTNNCGYCRGDGKGYVSLSVMEVTTGEDGIVSFENIPSGHVYMLQETIVPEGHKRNGNTYQVTVAYDELTVTVKDADGNDVPWEEFIENHTEYKLPNTGGMGTHHLTFGGLLMIAAALMYGCSQRRKRGRRGSQ